MMGQSEVGPQEASDQVVEAPQKAGVRHRHVHFFRAPRDLGYEKTVRHSLVNRFQYESPIHQNPTIIYTSHSFINVTIEV